MVLEQKMPAKLVQDELENSANIPDTSWAYKAGFYKGRCWILESENDKLKKAIEEQEKYIKVLMDKIKVYSTNYN